MKIRELKEKIQRYQYMEDTDIIDAAIAALIATRLFIGSPVWLVIIGPSSGGKSQILRPLAMTDKKFIHRVDDLTENTFLSGGNISGGADPSLLNRIGEKGMIVISDMTVIFSKPIESRNALLSQMRMVYDGEMTKFVGNKITPISWKGSIGVLAGSTPSIYRSFEEVADMGERFIHYRMKEYNSEKAMRISMGRKLFGEALDIELSDLYVEYMKEIVSNWEQKDIQLPEFVIDRIIKVSSLCEKIRTVSHTDFKDRTIDRIPIPAKPMRVALQLTSLAKGLSIMREHEEKSLGEDDIRIIDWCAYSLANEEKRACLRILAQLPNTDWVKTQTIADEIGLSTQAVNMVLQNMSATGVLKRHGDFNGLSWKIMNDEDWRLIREIESITTDTTFIERDISSEEENESMIASAELFDQF